jgi:hypothetical protein
MRSQREVHRDGRRTPQEAETPRPVHVPQRDHSDERQLPLTHRQDESAPKRDQLRRAYRVALTAVCLGLGAGGVPAACRASHPAQYRYLTEQKNRLDIPAHYEPLTFVTFLALPALPADYAASDWAIVRSYTQLAVSLDGYIAEVFAARDGATYGRPPDQGDLHVHLRDAQLPQCNPAGPRGGQIVTEVTPPFQPPKTDWSYEALLDLCRRQVRVRISGWLLHDYPHVKDVGSWRASAWEIHPITDIEVWEPEREKWQKVPSR